MNNLNISLIFSLGITGDVVMLGADGNEKLIHLQQNFNNPTSIAREGDKLAIACKSEVIELTNELNISVFFPNERGIYETLYFPVMSYYTGQTELHDLKYIDNSLLAVDKSTSSICRINENYIYRMEWNSNDFNKFGETARLNISGFAIEDEKARYVTADKIDVDTYSQTKYDRNRGVLVDIKTNEILLEGLSCPNSPRIYNDKLYFLNSGKGELCVFNREEKSYEVINDLGGYACGMDKFGDYLFIAVSGFASDDKTEENLFCGIVVIHLPSQFLVGRIKFNNPTGAVTDCKVIEGYTRAGFCSFVNDFSQISFPHPAESIA